MKSSPSLAAKGAIAGVLVGVTGNVIGTCIVAMVRHSPWWHVADNDAALAGLAGAAVLSGIAGAIIAAAMAGDAT